MAERSWEQCVREVTIAGDPETVASVGMGWHSLATALGYLRDELVGRSSVQPGAADAQRPQAEGLPAMLAGWKGGGGEAYREHLAEIGKSIEELIATAGDVSGALSRIDGDLRKAVANIPIPMTDDFGWTLPNGTPLDGAHDAQSAADFLAALRKDHQSNPAAYADGAFREKADELNATTKLDGLAAGSRRGGLWDTVLQLDEWYNANQQLANDAMSPLPSAVQAERPKLVVRAPDQRDSGDVGIHGGGDAAPPTGHPGGGGAYGSSLAGAGAPTVAGGHIGAAGLGSGGAPHPLGGLGSGSPGPGAGGIGGGAAGGMGMGAVPGMVGGGNGRVPPMTSPASALRSAASASTGPGPLPGQESMGYGDPATDRLDWSFRDDDPWGAYEPAPPGILR